MPIVNVEGVGPVEFPDTLTGEQIQASLRRDYPLLLSATGPPEQRAAGLQQARQVLAREAIQETPPAQMFGINLPNYLIDQGTGFARGFLQQLPSMLLDAAARAEALPDPLLRPIAPWVQQNLGVPLTVEQRQAAGIPGPEEYRQRYQAMIGQQLPALPDTGGGFVDRLGETAGSVLGGLAGYLIPGAAAARAARVAEAAAAPLGLVAAGAEVAPQAAPVLSQAVRVATQYALPGLAGAQQGYEQELARQAAAGEPRNEALTRAKGDLFGAVSAAILGSVGPGQALRRLTEPVLAEGALPAIVNPLQRLAPGFLWGAGAGGANALVRQMLIDQQLNLPQAAVEAGITGLTQAGLEGLGQGLQNVRVGKILDEQEIAAIREAYRRQAYNEARRKASDEYYARFGRRPPYEDIIEAEIVPPGAAPGAARGPVSPEAAAETFTAPTAAEVVTPRRRLPPPPEGPAELPPPSEPPPPAPPGAVPGLRPDVVAFIEQLLARGLTEREIVSQLVRQGKVDLPAPEASIIEMIRSVRGRQPTAAPTVPTLPGTAIPLGLPPAPPLPPPVPFAMGPPVNIVGPPTIYGPPAPPIQLPAPPAIPMGPPTEFAYTGPGSALFELLQRREQEERARTQRPPILRGASVSGMFPAAPEEIYGMRPVDIVRGAPELVLEPTLGSQALVQRIEKNLQLSPAFREVVALVNRIYPQAPAEQKQQLVMGVMRKDPIYSRTFETIARPEFTGVEKIPSPEGAALAKGLKGPPYKALFGELPPENPWITAGTNYLLEEARRIRAGQPSLKTEMEPPALFQGKPGARRTRALEKIPKEKKPPTKKPSDKETRKRLSGTEPRGKKPRAVSVKEGGKKEVTSGRVLQAHKRQIRKILKGVKPEKLPKKVAAKKVTGFTPEELAAAVEGEGPPAPAPKPKRAAQKRVRGAAPPRGETPEEAMARIAAKADKELARQREITAKEEAAKAKAEEAKAAEAEKTKELLKSIYGTEQGPDIRKMEGVPVEKLKKLVERIEAEDAEDRRAASAAYDVAVATAPKIVDTNDIVLDVLGETDPATLKAIADDPRMTEWSMILNDVTSGMRDILAMALPKKAYHSGNYRGLLSPTSLNLGINVGITGKTGDVYVNPFGTLAQYPDPEEFIGTVIGVIFHELNHQVTSDEAEAMARAMTLSTGYLLHPEADALREAVTRLRQHVLEEGGLDVIKHWNDTIAATAAPQPTGGGGVPELPGVSAEPGESVQAPAAEGPIPRAFGPEPKASKTARGALGFEHTPEQEAAIRDRLNKLRELYGTAEYGVVTPEQAIDLLAQGASPSTRSKVESRKLGTYPGAMWFVDLIENDRSVDWNKVTREKLLEEVAPNFTFKWREQHKKVEPKVNWEHYIGEMFRQAKEGNKEMLRELAKIMREPNEYRQGHEGALADSMLTEKQRWNDFIGNVDNPFIQGILYKWLSTVPSHKSGPIFIPQSAERLVEQIGSSPKFDISKRYKELSLQLLEHLKERVQLPDGRQWIKIPSQAQDPENFEANARALQMFSCPLWCTANSSARRLLQQGSFWLLMNEATPEATIVLEDDGSVNQVQDAKNLGYKAIDSELKPVVDDMLRKVAPAYLKETPQGKELDLTNLPDSRAATTDDPREIAHFASMPGFRRAIIVNSNAPMDMRVQLFTELVKPGYRLRDTLFDVLSMMRSGLNAGQIKKLSDAYPPAAPYLRLYSAFPESFLSDLAKGQEALARSSPEEVVAAIRAKSEQPVVELPKWSTHTRPREEVIKDIDAVLEPGPNIDPLEPETAFHLALINEPTDEQMKKMVGMRLGLSEQGYVGLTLGKIKAPQKMWEQYFKVADSKLPSRTELGENREGIANSIQNAGHDPEMNAALAKLINEKALSLAVVRTIAQSVNLPLPLVRDAILNGPYRNSVNLFSSYFTRDILKAHGVKGLNMIEGAFTKENRFWSGLKDSLREMSPSSKLMVIDQAVEARQFGELVLKAGELRQDGTLAKWMKQYNPAKYAADSAGKVYHDLVEVVRGATGDMNLEGAKQLLDKLREAIVQANEKLFPGEIQSANGPIVSHRRAYLLEKINAFDQLYEKTHISKSPNFGIEAVYTPDGKMHFVLSNIRDPDRAQELFLHEFTHGNLAKLDVTLAGRQELALIYNSVAKDLIPYLAPFLQEQGYEDFEHMAKEYGYDTSTPEGRTLALGEGVARAAEKMDPDPEKAPSWWQRLLLRLKLWLAKWLKWNISVKDLHVWLAGRFAQQRAAAAKAREEGRAPPPPEVTPESIAATQGRVQASKPFMTPAELAEAKAVPGVTPEQKAIMERQAGVTTAMVPDAIHNEVLALRAPNASKIDQIANREVGWLADLRTALVQRINAAPEEERPALAFMVDQINRKLIYQRDRLESRAEGLKDEFDAAFAKLPHANAAQAAGNYHAWQADQLTRGMQDHMQDLAANAPAGSNLQARAQAILARAALRANKMVIDDEDAKRILQRIADDPTNFPVTPGVTTVKDIINQAIAVGGFTVKDPDSLFFMLQGGPGRLGPALARIYPDLPDVILTLRGLRTTGTNTTAQAQAFANAFSRATAGKGRVSIKQFAAKLRSLERAHVLESIYAKELSDDYAKKRNNLYGEEKAMDIIDRLSNSTEYRQSLEDAQPFVRWDLGLVEEDPDKGGIRVTLPGTGEVTHILRAPTKDTEDENRIKLADAISRFQAALANPDLDPITRENYKEALTKLAMQFNDTSFQPIYNAMDNLFRAPGPLSNPHLRMTMANLRKFFSAGVIQNIINEIGGRTGERAARGGFAIAEMDDFIHRVHNDKVVGNAAIWDAVGKAMEAHGLPGRSSFINGRPTIQQTAVYNRHINWILGQNQEFRSSVKAGAYTPFPERFQILPEDMKVVHLLVAHEQRIRQPLESQPWMMETGIEDVFVTKQITAEGKLVDVPLKGRRKSISFGPQVVSRPLSPRFLAIKPSWQGWSPAERTAFLMHPDNFQDYILGYIADRNPEFVRPTKPYDPAKPNEIDGRFEPYFKDIAADLMLSPGAGISDFGELVNAVSAKMIARGMPYAGNLAQDLQNHIVGEMTRRINGAFEEPSKPPEPLGVIPAGGDWAPEGEITQLMRTFTRGLQTAGSFLTPRGDAILPSTLFQYSKITETALAQFDSNARNVLRIRFMMSLISMFKALDMARAKERMAVGLMPGDIVTTAHEKASRERERQGLTGHTLYEYDLALDRVRTQIKQFFQIWNQDNDINKVVKGFAGVVHGLLGGSLLSSPGSVINNVLTGIWGNEFHLNKNLWGLGTALARIFTFPARAIRHGAPLLIDQLLKTSHLGTVRGMARAGLGDWYEDTLDMRDRLREMNLNPERSKVEGTRNGWLAWLILKSYFGVTGPQLPSEQFSTGQRVGKFLRKTGPLRLLFETVPRKFDNFINILAGFRAVGDMDRIQSFTPLILANRGGNPAALDASDPAQMIKPEEVGIKDINLRHLRTWLRPLGKSLEELVFDYIQRWHAAAPADRDAVEFLNPEQENKWLRIMAMSGNVIRETNAPSYYGTGPLQRAFGMFRSYPDQWLGQFRKLNRTMAGTPPPFRRGPAGGPLSGAAGMKRPKEWLAWMVGFLGLLFTFLMSFEMRRKGVKLLTGKESSVPDLSTAAKDPLSMSAVRYAMAIMTQMLPRMPLLQDTFMGGGSGSPLTDLASYTPYAGLIADAYKTSTNIAQGRDPFGQAVNFIQRWVPISQVPLNFAGQAGVPIARDITDYQQIQNAMRLLRGAAPPGVDIRMGGGQFQPSRLSGELRQIELAALRNDDRAMRAAYEAAVTKQMALRGVDRQEAEQRINAALRSRNIESRVFERKLTPMEAAELSTRLSPTGRETVRRALRAQTLAGTTFGATTRRGGAGRGLAGARGIRGIRRFKLRKPKLLRGAGGTRKRRQSALAGVLG